MVLNAEDAARRGATVAVRTAFLAAAARRRWLDLPPARRQADGAERAQVRARALVNAAGPWVDQALGMRRRCLPPGAGAAGARQPHRAAGALRRASKPTSCRTTTGRVVFVIPYEGRFSLVGTTDVPHAGDPASPLHAGGGGLPVRRGRPAVPPRRRGRRTSSGRYSGVRPLLDDGAGDPSAVTRDYVLTLDAARGRGRRCSRCSAARSPPSAAWRRKRWAGLGGALGRARHALDRGRAAAGRRPRRAACRPSRLRRRDAIPGCRRRCCAAWCAPMAPSWRRCWTARRAGGPRRGSRRRPHRARAGLAAARGMGAHRRGRAVAPHQARPAPQLVTTRSGRGTVAEVELFVR